MIKLTLNNDNLPISKEINIILIKYASALDEIAKLIIERDDLQKAVNGLCEHIGVSPANTTLLAVEVLRIERERNEAREALREIWKSGDAFLPHVDLKTTNRWRRAAGWEETK